MMDFQFSTDVPQSPAIGPSLASRARAWISAWFKERSDEGPSWLVSLVLHLAIVFLLFLSPIAFSGHNEAGGFSDVLTRLEAGGDSGLLDGTVFLEGKGTSDDRSADKNELGAFDDAARVHLNSLDLIAAGTADDDDDDDELPEPTRLPEPLMNNASPTSVIDFDRDDAKKAAGSKTGKASGKASAAKGRKPSSGKEEPINVAGILGGRDPAMRAALVKSAGGTKESERAVEIGLDWLVRHQQPDGSWSFQHGPDDPGAMVCPMGATGLALLAFLGAGHTHQKGIYRSQVDMGLKYLISNMEETGTGGWLRGTGLATMYVQGIGTIALCEACSMTKDPKLRRPAQLAVDFIVKAQDPEGGGWRYFIPQAGDTSVVGWQVMALQSARIAELNVPPQVFVKVKRFLKSVEVDGGGMYGYTNPRTARPSTTAVALLCQMYLGRSQEHKGMIRGMTNLSKWGPDPSDMYYSYYATQAMHHWGDSRWQKWNAVMRDQLVNSQAQSGDAAGSWVTDRSHHSNAGGRLYTTCLSIMTLEVYYRFLPIYRKPSVAEPIPTSAAVAAGEIADPEPDASKSERPPAAQAK
jgi:hypothetical protein